jgi:hypothetical protein
MKHHWWEYVLLVVGLIVALTAICLCGLHFGEVPS